MGLAMTYELPAIVGALAIGAGAEIKVAYALRAAVASALTQQVEQILGRLGAKLSSELMYAPAALVDLDWAAMAAKRGEKADLDAWQKWTADKFGKARAAEP